MKGIYIVAIIDGESLRMLRTRVFLDNEREKAVDYFKSLIRDNFPDVYNEIKEYDWMDILESGYLNDLTHYSVIFEYHLHA